MYICICKGIRESDVQELGRAGVTCPKKLASALELNDKKNCCGRCIKNISKFVALAEEEYSCSNSPVLG
jgi:bacterioferritin-associated ferredoxin